MRWNIAEAKQKFSDVVRQSAEEPQLIYNRERPVAAIVDAETFLAFQAWREREAHRSLGQAFAEFRRLCGEEGAELKIPPRSDRPNLFASELDELPR
jgi:prevent-host-death family protein